MVSETEIDFFPIDVEEEIDHAFYEEDYMGPFSELSMVLTGPPFMLSTIRGIIVRTMESQGLYPIEIDILETSNIEFLGISITRYYAVKAYFHESPVLPAVVATWLPVLWIALGVIIVYTIVWKVFGYVKEREKTRQIIETGRVAAEVENQQAKARTVCDGLPEAEKLECLRLIEETLRNNSNNLANILKREGGITSTIKWAIAGVVAAVGIAIVVPAFLKR